MFLAVIEYIVGFAGVVVLSILCLHHGRHISSQVCSRSSVTANVCTLKNKNKILLWHFLTTD